MMVWHLPPFFTSVLWIFDHGKIAQNIFILHLSALCLALGFDKTMWVTFLGLPHNSLEKFGLDNFDQTVGQEEIHIIPLKMLFHKAS